MPYMYALYVTHLLRAIWMLLMLVLYMDKCMSYMDAVYACHIHCPIRMPYMYALYVVHLILILVPVRARCPRRGGPVS